MNGIDKLKALKKVLLLANSNIEDRYQAKVWVDILHGASHELGMNGLVTLNKSFIEFGIRLLDAWNEYLNGYYDQSGFVSYCNDLWDDILEPNLKELKKMEEEENENN